jgi:hypothetical protein
MTLIFVLRKEKKERGRGRGRGRGKKEKRGKERGKKGAILYSIPIQAFPSGSWIYRTNHITIPYFIYILS